MKLSAFSVTALALAAATSLSACGGAGDATGERNATAEASTKDGVKRTEVVAEESPVKPMAPVEAIQSQPGPGGSQVDLTKVAVTGDILTVTLRCSSEQNFNSQVFRIDDISVIDDTTAQRIGVLKDNQGKPLVSSPTPSGDSLTGSCDKKPGVIWAKFPAPPATSKTISINFPKVGPFDGVTVTR